MNKEYRLTIFAFEKYNHSSKMHKFSLSDYYEDDNKLNELLKRISVFYLVFEVSRQEFDADKHYDFVAGDELL